MTRFVSGRFISNTPAFANLLHSSRRSLGNPTTIHLQSNPLFQQTQKNQPQGYQHHHPFVTTQSRMTTSLAASNIPEIITAIGPVKAIGSFVGVVSLLALISYRNAIKRRIRQVREESWIFGAGVQMERINDEEHIGKNKKVPTGVFQNLRLMEMNPEFEAKCQKEGRKMISLGDYMASLRPKGLPKKISVEDTPKIIQREIEAGLASGLLKVLGPNLGRALLPTVGTGLVQNKAQGLAAGIATKWFMSEEGSISQSQDKGGIPISLLAVLAISDANAKLNSGKNVTNDEVVNLGLNAIDKMKVGEIVKGPTFVQGLDDTSLIPNDFVISEHFDSAIHGLEEVLASHEEKGDMTNTELKIAQDEVIERESSHRDSQEYRAKQIDHQYDPEDRSAGEPVPVNPRLFPDLYLGWGDAKFTHTKREVLKMRLISLLLNRLGSNYYRLAEGESKEKLFSVRMTPDDKAISTPWEFVKALVESGHEVEVVPTSRMTTFGMALCVKERDGSWANIPLGVFLETGYEDKHGNMAPAMMPHSGLDMFIRGPITGNRADGTPSELRVQHFVGIEGFCGWKPSADPEVPYNDSVEMGSRLSGSDAIRAARIASLYANILNGLATEMELPFGGYGLTAVCNDSAALVQQCLYGVNTIYPMTSIGRYMLRSMRYAERFQDKLRDAPGLESEVKEITAITDAMKQIPSDLNASPANSASAATRLLATLQPKLPLLLMKDSKRVMESILNEDILQEGQGEGQTTKEKVDRVIREKETTNESWR